MGEVRDKVLAVVGDESGTTVEPNTTLEELGLDSLETLNLFMRISSEVGEVPDLLIPDFTTVGDVIGYLERQ